MSRALCLLLFVLLRALISLAVISWVSTQSRTIQWYATLCGAGFSASVGTDGWIFAKFHNADPCWPLIRVRPSFEPTSLDVLQGLRTMGDKPGWSNREVPGIIYVRHPQAIQLAVYHWLITLVLGVTYVVLKLSIRRTPDDDDSL